MKADEPLVELETDKVTVEVPAPSAGVLADIKVEKGATVAVGAILAFLNEGKGGAAAPVAPAPAAKPAAAPAPAPAAAAAPTAPMPPAPAARKIMDEAGIDPASVAGSGRRGQVLKEDAMAAASAPKPAAPAQSTAVTFASMSTPAVAPTQARAPSIANDAAREERVPMSRLRQTIARRLKDAQNTAAMLTTFNDVDMSNVMALRNQYKDLSRSGTA